MPLVEPCEPPGAPEVPGLQTDPACKAGAYFKVRASASDMLKALEKSRFLPNLEDPGPVLCDVKRVLLRAGGFVLNLRRRESVASELSVRGHSVPVVPFPQGTMCLLNFALDPAAGESCCKDQAIFYIRRSSFDRLADDLGAGRISDLSLTAGAASNDGLMTHLGACLLPAVEQPDQIDDLIVDQIAGAVHTHLAQRFGAMKHPPKPGKGGLAPWQLKLAQKTLSEHAESHAILDRVASECKLSVSHFIRAFTRSAGMPPHRWLTRCRIERATGLLRASTLTLSEIALACGFFDQSHFSRVFSQSVGMAPGQWRKLHPPSAAARVKEKKALLF